MQAQAEKETVTISLYMTRAWGKGVQNLQNDNQKTVRLAAVFFARINVGGGKGISLIGC